MKNLVLFIFLLGVAWSAPAQDFDALLKQHVVNGQVNYRALQANPASLKVYLAEAAAVSEADFKIWKSVSAPS